jgi:hypothetical protein
MTHAVDASFFATADPATLLFTSAVLDDVLARATALFVENEFLEDASVKFACLARGSSPVDSLGVATRGELELSPRYQEILAPMDLGDEVRAALMVGSKCWGFMCLHRERSSSNFTPAEAAFLAKLAPHLAEGLRTSLLLIGGAQATSLPPESTVSVRARPPVLLADRREGPFPSTRAYQPVSTSACWLVAFFGADAVA